MLERYDFLCLKDMTLSFHEFAGDSLRELVQSKEKEGHGKTGEKLLNEERS